MNDNHQLQRRTLIEMIADDETLAVICSEDVDPAILEMAASIIRANKDLWFIEMQDLNGGLILAYRGEPPPCERSTL